MSDSYDSDSKVSGSDQSYTGSYRSIESSKSNGSIGPIDITPLENDGAKLLRKAAKRLNKDNSGRESFLEKMIHWQRKLKLDKIRVLLDSLFPKLKHTEEEVRIWLDSVQERKEIACMNGKTLLRDVELQIGLFQNHLDFLDDVVNDVRQLDYEIVKEISELKTAFHFNQELLSKSSKSNSLNGISSIETCDGIAAIPSQEEQVIKCFHKNPICTPPSDEPAVWQGMKGVQHSKIHFASSPFTKSISKLLSSETSRNLKEEPSPSKAMSKSQQSNSTQAPNFKIPPPYEVPSSDHSVESKDPELIWDGEASKRKSLKSVGDVSIQSLLSVDHCDSNKLSKSKSVGAHTSNTSQSNSNSGSLLVNSLTRTRSSSHEENKGGSTPAASTANVTQAQSGQTKKQPWSPSFGKVTIPSLRQISATGISPKNSISNLSSKSFTNSPEPEAKSSCISSHKLANITNNNSINITDDKSYSIGEDLLEINSIHGTPLTRKRTPPAHPYNNKVSLSNILQKIPDMNKESQVGIADPDQIEMAHRIEKCRSLKETLKEILKTLQTTQETEHVKLKKMKKLRTDLQGIFTSNEGSTYGGSDMFSATNSCMGSKEPSYGNLVALGDSPSKFHQPTAISERLLERGLSIESSHSDYRLNRSTSPRISHPSTSSLNLSSFTGIDSDSTEQSASPSERDSNKRRFSMGLERERADRSRKSTSPIPLLSDHDIHEIAGDYVNEFKSLLVEEQDAKLKLNKLEKLIDHASDIDLKLNHTTNPTTTH